MRYGGLLRNKLNLLIFILIISIFLTSGCVEISNSTKSAGNALAGFEIIEHTYLWGEEGPFTKLYDVRVWTLGIDIVEVKGLTQDQMERLLSQYD